jgi:quercetin dioxygenase-like cupin family protein
MNKKMIIEIKDDQNSTKAVKEYRIGSGFNEEQITVRSMTMPPGKYTAIWRADQNEFGRKEFEIINK